MRETAEDEFAARDLAAYAVFLRQTPWYAYPCGPRVAAFWRETPWRGVDLLRKLERRVVFTLEYGTKAIYGGLIGQASASALGLADQEIRTVVVGLQASDVARDPRIKVVRELGAGSTLVVTPRYRAYTEVVVGLARRGRDLAEIAGNRRILMTVQTPSALPAVPGAQEMFAVPMQSGARHRRVGLDVPVADLASAIRSLEAAKVTVEHLYDY